MLPYIGVFLGLACGGVSLLLFTLSASIFTDKILTDFSDRVMGVGVAGCGMALLALAIMLVVYLG